MLRPVSSDSHMDFLSPFHTAMLTKFETSWHRSSKEGGWYRSKCFTYRISLSSKLDFAHLNGRTQQNDDKCYSRTAGLQVPHFLHHFQELNAVLHRLSDSKAFILLPSISLLSCSFLLSIPFCCCSNTPRGRCAVQDLRADLYIK